MRCLPCRVHAQPWRLSSMAQVPSMQQSASSAPISVTRAGSILLELKPKLRGIQGTGSAHIKGPYEPAGATSLKRFNISGNPQLCGASLRECHLQVSCKVCHLQVSCQLVFLQHPCSSEAHQQRQLSSPKKPGRGPPINPIPISCPGRLPRPIMPPGRLLGGRGPAGGGSTGLLSGPAAAVREGVAGGHADIES